MIKIFLQICSALFHRNMILKQYKIKIKSDIFFSPQVHHDKLNATCPGTVSNSINVTKFLWYMMKQLISHTKEHNILKISNVKKKITDST